MPHSFLAQHFKQDTRTAALLVAIVTISIWFVFNLLVEAYPDAPQHTYQAATTSSEIGYPYRVQP